LKKVIFRPRWWILYLSAAFVFGLFLLEARARLSEVGHTWVEIGLVLIQYGLVMIWLNANEVALLNEEREKYKKQAIRPVFVAPQPKNGNLDNRSGSGRPQDPGYHHKGLVVPAWLISLAAMLIAFFKTQDQ